MSRRDVEGPLSNHAGNMKLKIGVGNAVRRCCSVQIRLPVQEKDDACFELRANTICPSCDF